MTLHPTTNPPTGRRAVLTGPRLWHIEHTAPPAPGPGEILVRVLFNGVCASDLPAWERGPQEGEQALVLGHEPVGRVIAAGPHVTAPAVGELVTGRLTGSFADLIVARAEDAVAVPAGVPPEAAIGEPLGCVVEALRRTRVDVGDRVAVVGLGFMGLCLLQLLAAGTTGALVAFDPREDSRRHALEHGAVAALDPRDAAALDGLRDGFDAVFEVSGTQPGLDLTTRLVRPHGTLCVVGYHQDVRAVDMQAWNWKAIDVVNGHVRDTRRLAESTRRGLAALAAGRIDYPALITHRYPLDRLDSAFRDLREKPDGFVKAVVAIAADDAPAR